MRRVNSAHGEERRVSNTARGHRHSRARSIPTLCLIQASRMTSLVSDNLMGASSSFPTPPQEKVLVHRSRRDATCSFNLLDDDSRKPKRRSRTRERMLGDSYWFMCDLDEQAITSGTTRTASARTGRWADIVSASIVSKGVT